MAMQIQSTPRTKQRGKPSKADIFAHTEETSRDRFRRLAPGRVRRALRSIRLIGNLSSQRYDWTDDELRLIREALMDCTDTTLTRFDKSRPPKMEESFTFDPTSTRIDSRVAH